MMQHYYRYYKQGLPSLKEGMTFTRNVVDKEGNLISGLPNPEKVLFKCEEITKEEWEEYQKQIADPSVPKGLAGGILNEKGIEDLKKYIEERKKELEGEQESKIALVVRKIKKQLELGIIEQDDIDMEIEQQNMSRFKDEIKKRLEIN